MFYAAYTSYSGIVGAQRLLDVTGNNVANSSTTGFKTSTINFQDLLYQNIQDQTANPVTNQVPPVGVSGGFGVAVGSIAGQFTQGPIQQTGNQLDLAIQGQGFFQVALPGGTTGYTRAGNLTTNSLGQIVTSDGFRLVPSITVPANTTAITVGVTGAVGVTSSASPGQTTTVGQITLARFINPAGLLQLGNTTYGASSTSGTPITGTPGTNGLGTIQSSSLEGSNVDVTTELTNLLVAQRTFSFNTQALNVSNQILQSALTLIP